MGLAIQCDRCGVFSPGKDVELAINPGIHWWAAKDWVRLFQHSVSTEIDVALCPKCYLHFNANYAAFMSEKL